MVKNPFGSITSAWINSVYERQFFFARRRAVAWSITTQSTFFDHFYCPAFGEHLIHSLGIFQKWERLLPLRLHGLSLKKV
jgi:hypothetical protein